MYYKNGDVFKGNWIDNKKNGYGVMTYSNNDQTRNKYEGYYKEDQRHGNGRILLKNGDVYDGEWKFSRFDGYGIYTYSVNNNEFVEYNGQFKEGVIQGKGKMKFKNGDTYDGQWNNGVLTGEGEMQFDYHFQQNKRNQLATNLNTLSMKQNAPWHLEAFKEYKGPLENGDFNGFGTLVFANDNIYKGNFVNNIATGNGLLIFSNNSNSPYKQYKGGFDNFKFNGIGELKFKNGDIYSGGFQDGLFEGEGTFMGSSFSLECVKYEGSWKKGSKEGFGVMEYINNDKYTGNFVNNMRHGYGTYIYLNPSYIGSIAKVEAQFVEDTINGNSKVWYKNGDYYEGEILLEQRNGQGFLKFSDSHPMLVSYKGDFVSDKSTGNGTMFFKNGDSYTGEFRDNVINGNGIITYANHKK